MIGSCVCYNQSLWTNKVLFERLTVIVLIIHLKPNDGMKQNLFKVESQDINESFLAAVLSFIIIEEN